MDPRHEQIVDSLLFSYRELGGINHLDCTNLPSKREINALCSDFLQLLFPGFLDEEPIGPGELAMLTSERIASVTKRLCAQINRSIQSETTNPPRASRDICYHFLASLPQIRQLLRTDVEAAYEGDPAARSFEEIILAYPAIEAIAIQRLAHQLYLAEVPLIPRIMTEWAHDKTGIDIHPGAKIGTHFFIDHGTGVVIGETCTIGTWVKLYHGVTLGARSFPKDSDGRIVKGSKRHPDVLDHVTIYPNATVLGGQTVLGEGSTIGANVFLMESVPAHSLVIYQDGGIRVFDKRERPDASPDAIAQRLPSPLPKTPAQTADPQV